MPARPTALASLARYALAAAASHRLDEEALLREAGLTRDEVDSLDGRVPVGALMRLWELAALHSGDPDYGLHVAERLASPQTEKALIAHCRQRLIKWSCPRDVEFRTELPKTRIGKIDYRALVEEHIARHQGI